MHLGAALADDDVPGDDGLAPELLHAEATALGVAPVAGAAAGFLVRHRSIPLSPGAPAPGGLPVTPRTVLLCRRLGTTQVGKEQGSTGAHSGSPYHEKKIPK